MREQSGHDTRPHAWLPHSFLGMDAWMTSQLNVAMFRKLRWSLKCLAYLLKCYQRVFYNQALADHRSTGAGIKCLNCMVCIIKQFACLLYVIRCCQSPFWIEFLYLSLCASLVPFHVIKSVSHIRWCRCGFCSLFGIRYNHTQYGMWSL